MFRREKISAAVAVLSVGVWFGVAAQGQVPSGSDAQIQADVHKQLDNKRFQNVTIAVQGGNVALAGTVDRYADKEDADRRAHHAKNVKGVDNDIRVAGPMVEDTTLRSKLSQTLSYEGVGYGTTAYNSITIGVENGVVTLGGTVYGPPDKDSAISLVANTAGVRDIVDNLEVLPMSPMDDRLRQMLARAIYGSVQLQRYALDPAKPIRITVVSGNVTLTGVVDNNADRDVAGIRANGVPGVFKVTNNLQVAGAQSGK